MFETFITIESGKIKERTKFQKFLFDVKDGRYLCKFENKNKRSHSQNSYYWAVVIPIILEQLRYAGYDEIKTPNDVHEILKYKFLRKQIPNDQGEFVEMLGSTAQLSKKEFGEYIDAICKWVGESFSINIPGPGSQAAINYE
jgi:hypothetical protein